MIEDSSSTIYHSGELAVQTKAGVADRAAGVGRVIDAAIPEIARQFLALQPLAIAASLDEAGRRWASALSGLPGFLASPDESTLTIGVHPAGRDPLHGNLANGGPIAILVLDPRSRKRMKIKGVARMVPGGILVSAERVYALCPKYIHLRELLPGRGSEAGPVRVSDRLSGAQIERIASADTFFIATHHPQTGADASHRGGLPGFVHVEQDRRLRFPDYAGNNMFNTLGNLEINPRAGLLFMDFDTGATLQMTGTARVLWDAETRAPFPGAQRVVEFDIGEIIDTPAAVPLRWRLVEISPFTRA